MGGTQFFFEFHKSKSRFRLIEPSKRGGAVKNAVERFSNSKKS